NHPDRFPSSDSPSSYVSFNPNPEKADTALKPLWKIKNCPSLFQEHLSGSLSLLSQQS
ncbi:hypothetical protein DNTS_009516, partial [Danionella cerebrum]